MRFLTTVFLSAVCVLFPSVPYVAGTAVDDDDDDDWSGIEVETEDDGDEDLSDAADTAAVHEQGDTTLAEAIDANLSHAERKIRMTMCIGIARQRYILDKDGFSEYVSKMAEAAGISEEQAVNELHVNMIKNCYLNLDQETDLKDLTSGDADKFDTVSARVIAPPASAEEGSKPATLLSRQWELISEIVEAEKNQGENGANDDPYNEFANIGRMELIGSKMSGFQKFLYFISVFGAVFGGGYLLVKKLIAYELEKNAKRISKKAARKDN